MSNLTMIEGENTNFRNTPEIRGLESMKENILTDRFKMVKNFDLNLLTTFEAVFIHRSGTKRRMLLASHLPLSVRLLGVCGFIIMMRCSSGMVRRWHPQPLQWVYMKGWQRLMTI